MFCMTESHTAVKNILRRTFPVRRIFLITIYTFSVTNASSKHMRTVKLKVLNRYLFIAFHLI